MRNTDALEKAHSLVAVRRIQSPIGELEICAHETGLLGLVFCNAAHRPSGAEAEKVTPLLNEAEAQVKAYFRGSLRAFDLPLCFSGSDFRNRVWRQLCEIPYGNTISYLSLAEKLGDRKCIRAAAAANGKNPISIIVPCHRVIAANGGLTGYSGELWRKRCLLEHEAKVSGRYNSCLRQTSLIIS